MTLMERVRRRVADLVEQHHITHERLGQALDSDRSNAGRMLKPDGPRWCLDAVERVCFLFQITPAELVAEPGALIQPTSPLEAELLGKVRRMTETQRMSLMNVLDWQAGSSHDRRKRGRPPRLTDEQRTLLALYSVADESVRHAAVGMLRTHPGS